MNQSRRTSTRKAPTGDQTRRTTRLDQATRKTHHRWLMELTALPTAAGREGRVVQYIKDWVSDRPGLSLKTDPHGNLTITRKNRRSASKNAPAPIIIEAHMDHPAFVVHQVIDAKTLLAEFRGGVKESYFLGSPILLHHENDKPAKGKITVFDTAQARTDPMIDDGNKIVRVTFAKPVTAAKGDVITWDVGKTRITQGRLHTTACDDLAAVAAALAAYDVWLDEANTSKADVRLLFTRAEEIGFIGAIAACKAGTVPKNARLICLENSKSFPESPIGGGPIVRVGDATSTFDPDLTFRCARLAYDAALKDPTFKYQRKLMAGGTCEASAFQTYGYTATCLCLPLGNYHNMNDATGKIDAETISTDDFDGLVRLLGLIIHHLDDPKAAPSLHTRLEDLYDKRKGVLTN